MSARFAKFAILVLLAGLLPTLSCQTVTAQTGLIVGRVGGVQIDAQGVLSKDFQSVDPHVRQQIEKSLHDTNADISTSTKLRMISLRGLEEAINKSVVSGQPLSSEVQYLAGLQRIEYVVLDSETNDLILAGPAEGWKLNEAGSVVGVTTNRPVIHLEDFLVAMRSVDAAGEGEGISVSIDPTEEGVKQLTNLFRQIKRASPQAGFDPAYQGDVEQAMGEHNIRLTGVPKDSRFAHILVAADYKMKRIAMGLEATPLASLPSLLELAVKSKAGRMKSAPRFWMECNYEPVAKSEDGKVWQLRGQGVRTLTEETMFTADGKRSSAKKSNRLAEKWAGLMTEHFEALSAADPTFGELRNVMDMSVIAALIKQQQLLSKVELQVPAIMGLTEVATTPAWTVPRKVPTQCSFVRLTKSWLVTASGGVTVDSWGVAETLEIDAEVGKVAEVALNKTADRWWWNAVN